MTDVRHLVDDRARSRWRPEALGSRHDFTRSGDTPVSAPLASVKQVIDESRFEVYVDEDGVCVVRGELDEFTGTELELRLSNRPAIDCIDLGEVSFVDSAGLRTLLVMRQRLLDDGRTLVVRRSSGAVRRVMRLAGVAHLFALEYGTTAAG
jgi:anti-anti-sigma factor